MDKFDKAGLVILISIVGFYLIEVKNILREVNTNLKQIEMNSKLIRIDTEYLADINQEKGE